MKARYNVEPIVLVFFLMRRFYVVRAWTDETCLWIETKDGQRVCSPFSKWKRLESATKDQRNDFVLGYTGIHWTSIDEDLGYEGLFVDAGLCESTPEEFGVVYDHGLVNTFFAHNRKNLPNCLAVREILFIFAVG